ncbi:hypothetical protein [Treponema primitia]|uniref:hypothetical protein n=1 Tax=Treponema primitia TaxID=88058 RepID=UPI000313191A|nr:hypothetical protein [Treponema primitia]
MTQENERYMNELAAKISLKQTEILMEKSSQAKSDENTETEIKAEFEPFSPIHNTLLKK